MAELRTPQGHTLLLPDGSVSIGADPANEVPVAAHMGLAPLHFRLQPWEGGHFIEDAGSGLGTLVNGHPVNWKPLVHGDVITAGALEVIYSQETSAAQILGPRPGPGLPGPPLLELPLPEAPLSLLLLDHPPLPTGQPAGSAPPPAWLPEDLLPEAYRTPAPAKAPAPDIPPAAPPQP